MWKYGISIKIICNKVFIANYEDHFTILFKLSGPIVNLKDSIDNLNEIDKILQSVMNNVTRS